MIGVVKVAIGVTRAMQNDNLMYEARGPYVRVSVCVCVSVRHRFPTFPALRGRFLALPAFPHVQHVARDEREASGVRYRQTDIHIRLYLHVISRYFILYVPLT